MSMARRIVIAIFGVWVRLRTSACEITDIGAMGGRSAESLSATAIRPAGSSSTG